MRVGAWGKNDARGGREQNGVSNTELFGVCLDLSIISEISRAVFKLLLSCRFMFFKRALVQKPSM